MCPPVCIYIVVGTSRFEKGFFGYLFFLFCFTKRKVVGKLVCVRRAVLGMRRLSSEGGGVIGRRMVKGGQGTIVSRRTTN